MRARQDTMKTRVLVALAAVPMAGCGALFNGPLQTVEVRTADPQAEIIANGAVVGRGKAEIVGTPTDPPSVYVRGADGALARADVRSSVGAGWVVLDVLAALTVVGIAAPLVDGMFGGWYSFDGPVDVELEPPRARPKRDIQYATATADDPKRYAR